MTSDQIRYFLEAAERGSMTAAAERLYLAQSTLSRQIALLEEEFGTRLFDRDKSGLRLTRAGEVFCDEVRAIYAREQNLRAKLEQADRGRPESFQLAILEETIPPEVLVRAVRALRDERPGIALTVRPMSIHGIFMALDTGSIDAAYTLRNNVEMVPDAEFLPVACEKMCVAADECAPLPDRATLTEDEVCRIAGAMEFYMIEPDIFGDRIGARLRRQLRSELSPHVRYAQSDGQITTQVLFGLGAALVHESHRLGRTPGICLRPVVDAAPVELVAAYRRQNENPALAAFLERLRAGLETARADG